MSISKAAFFDRDGTIIKDVPYLSKIDQIEFIPFSIKLCKLLADKGYKIIIVTNQSGIARGLFNENDLHIVNTYIEKELLNHKIKIEKFYFCPHHPTEAKILKFKFYCNCRKPEPGMLLKAEKDFSLDLSQSLLFGDKHSDILAGESVGIKSFYIQQILENDIYDVNLLINLDVKIKEAVYE